MSITTTTRKCNKKKIYKNKNRCLLLLLPSTMTIFICVCVCIVQLDQSSVSQVGSCELLAIHTAPAHKITTTTTKQHLSSICIESASKVTFDSVIKEDQRMMYWIDAPLPNAKWRRRMRSRRENWCWTRRRKKESSPPTGCTRSYKVSNTNSKEQNQSSLRS